jgi:hypothetical protein
MKPYLSYLGILCKHQLDHVWITVIENSTCRWVECSRCHKRDIIPQAEQPFPQNIEKGYNKDITQQQKEDDNEPPRRA